MVKVFIQRDMRTHQQTNGPKTAVGYVRVSTQEQATEWGSLDAQRDRLRAYCKVHGIKLINIKADEGIRVAIWSGRGCKRRYRWSGAVG